MNSNSIGKQMMVLMDIAKNTKKEQMPWYLPANFAIESFSIWQDPGQLFL